MSQSNLANVYRNLGRYAEAAGLLENALASAIKNFGKGHPSVAVRQSNLGMVHLETKEYEKAISLFQDAYDLYARLLGEEHPNTQTIGRNLQYAKRIARNQKNNLVSTDSGNKKKGCGFGVFLAVGFCFFLGWLMC